MDSVITLRKFCQGAVCLQGNDSVLEFQVYQRKHFKGIRKKKNFICGGIPRITVRSFAQV